MVTQHGRIKGKAREYNREQNHTGEAQARVRDTTKQPAKNCALQGPTHCDPLSIELDRENQRDEEQGRPSKESKLRISGLSGGWCALEQNKKSKERRQRKCQWHETGDPARISVSHKVIHQVKIQWPSQRCGNPWRSFPGKLPMENERKDREHRVKSEIPNQWRYRA